MAVSTLHRTPCGRASLLSLDKCNKYLLHLQTVSIQRDRESVGNIYEGRGRGRAGNEPSRSLKFNNHGEGPLKPPIPYDLCVGNPI